MQAYVSTGGYLPKFLRLFDHSMASSVIAPLTIGALNASRLRGVCAQHGFTLRNDTGNVRNQIA
jgi:hypothetical protein